MTHSPAPAASAASLPAWKSRDAAVLAAVKRALPKDLQHAIAKHSVAAFARNAASLVHSVLFTYRLASLKMVQNLQYVLAVKRCTATPKFLALGLYERSPVPFPVPYPVNYVNVEPLDRAMEKQHEDWLVCGKRPVRYAAVIFRVTPLHGPWRRGDRSAKVTLDPVRSATAVLGGETIWHARDALYRMTRTLARTVITDRPVLPLVPRM